MRTMFVLLVLLLILISALTSCNASNSIASLTPAPVVTKVPAASPALSVAESASIAPYSAVAPEFEAIITDYVSAQNAHDWDKFTGLWTKKAQAFLKDFFAYTDNKKNKSGYFAIESAELLSSVEIEDFKNEAESATCYETKNYEEVRVFSVVSTYHLSKNFWGYSEGKNFIEMVLVKEDGVWKISQDSLMIDWEADDDYVYTDHSHHRDGTVHFKKKITGYYLATEWGDYAHIIIMKLDGEQIELWDNSGLDRDEESDDLMLPFLQKIRITWTNHDSYIEEAGKVENQDAATDIKLLD